MANNCCDTQIIDGGTILQPTITDPIITGGTWTGGRLEGGVTFDEATSVAVASQVCAYLQECILQAINGSTLADVTLNNPVINDAQLRNAVIESLTINGNIQLDDTAKTLLASQITEALKPNLEAWIQGLIDTSIDYPVTSVNGEVGDVVLDAAAVGAMPAQDGTATNPILNNATANGLTINSNIELDDDVKLLLANKIAAALQPELQSWVQGLIDASIAYPVTSVNGKTGDVVLSSTDVGAIPTTGGTATNLTVNNGTLNGVTLGSGTINNTVINDPRLYGTTTVYGDIMLSSTATQSLCTALTPCMENVADIAFDPASLAAVFQDCEGVPRAPGTRVPSCADMASAIDNAIKSLPAIDVIKGLEYDEATHTLRIETQLADGTPQFWSVALDSFGGQVVTDNTTIGGMGVTGDPLRVILNPAVAPNTTAGVELPTTLYGSRSALLGEPAAWISLGGYVLPVYNQVP